tara:strand:+ start:400 stop:621 length:222 start_codon:yes stop_codon:yes gene_type:complete
MKTIERGEERARGERERREEKRREASESERERERERARATLIGTPYYSFHVKRNNKEKSYPHLIYFIILYNLL